MVLPPFPYPGGVQGAEPPDPVAGATGHFSWSNWIKAAVKKLDAEATPVGVILSYIGVVAPPGWHLCNGTQHGSAALLALTGNAYTPNLMDRFIVGSGSSYSLAEIGGAAQVALTGAQSGFRDHTHATYLSSNVGPVSETDIPARGSGGTADAGFRSQWATESPTYNSANYGNPDGAPHENRPPYYALAWIIKK